MIRALTLALLLSLTANAVAIDAEPAFSDPAMQERYERLTQELRCLVCQNQTIADSNAPLALDLRNQIRTQIAQGRSDSQIRDYMVERYGDFVLYKPPLKATTVVLWLGPLALTIGGWLLFVFVVRRRRQVAASEPDTPLPEKEKARIASLLEGADAAPVALPQAGRPRSPRKARR